MEKDDIFKRLREKICEFTSVLFATVITSPKKGLHTTNLYKQCFACKNYRLSPLVKKRIVPISANLLAHSREEFCPICYKELKEELKDKFNG